MAARIIQFALSIIAIVFLAMIAGAAAIHFDFFPGRQLENAFLATDALLKERHQLSRPFNGGGILRVDHDKSGVTIWDRDAAYTGYTLAPTAHGQTVDLIDMEGTPVHRWKLDYLGMWNDQDQVQNPVPERFIFVRKARLEPNGDLLVIFSAWATTPHGYGIAKVDKDSNVLWSNFRHIHHSFDQVDGGNIVALDHEVRTEAPAYIAELPVPYLDDGVSIYSPEGEYLERFSLIDSFVNSPYQPVLAAIALQHDGGGLGDFLHSNDIEILRANMEHMFPMARAGDLLISFRELNGIAILDSETRSVKWFQRGYWHRQHDADFLANGNMLLFDNIALKLDANNLRSSRVLEFDPITMETVWEYSSTKEQPFYSNSRSSQQRLQNGNTLITESNSGRVFEVGRDGNIVWEYYNPVRLGENNQMIPGVFWATRYTSADIDFGLSPPL